MTDESMLKKIFSILWKKVINNNIFIKKCWSLNTVWSKRYLVEGTGVTDIKVFQKVSKFWEVGWELDMNLCV